VKLTKLPAKYARTATRVISERRAGAIALRAAMRMPSDPGLANPQSANVAIEALRGCEHFIGHSSNSSSQSVPTYPYFMLAHQLT